MTALISVIPILLLIVLMMGFKVSGYKSAVITLIVTVALALFAVPAMGHYPSMEHHLPVKGPGEVQQRIQEDKEFADHTWHDEQNMQICPDPLDRARGIEGIIKQQDRKKPMKHKIHII